VTVNAGTFQMGSPETESGRRTREDLHEVTITRDYAIYSVEVTQKWFELTMGYNPSMFDGCGDDCPVETVSWHEAAAFCNELSNAEGKVTCYTCTGSDTEVECDLDAAFATPYDCPGIRLPTEAEWEYAARAETDTATYNGDLDDAHLECEQPNPVLDGIAWFCGNSADSPHPAGEKDPNDWGLHDMMGNVWEWSHDWLKDDITGDNTDPWGLPTGTDRAARGGAWNVLARFSRAANRTFDAPPALAKEHLGFRPVRTLNP
jgi:formylglycine-generating enzyme required for sulfatase activity